MRYRGSMPGRAGELLPRERRYVGWGGDCGRVTQVSRRLGRAERSAQLAFGPVLVFCWVSSLDEQWRGTRWSSLCCCSHGCHHVLPWQVEAEAAQQGGASAHRPANHFAQARCMAVEKRQLLQLACTCEDVQASLCDCHRQLQDLHPLEPESRDQLLLRAGVPTPLHREHQAPHVQAGQKRKVRGMHVFQHQKIHRSVGQESSQSIAAELERAGEGDTAEQQVLQCVQLSHPLWHCSEANAIQLQQREVAHRRQHAELIPFLLRVGRQRQTAQSFQRLQIALQRHAL